AYTYFKNLGFEVEVIYWDLFQEEKIAAIVQDLINHRPDIFIPNYFPFAFYAGRWAKKAGIPTVMILHNDDEFHHALVDAYADEKDPFAVDAIVGVSKLITDMIVASAPHHPLVQCIPYGAPLPNTAATLAAGDVLKLVYAGRIVEPQKRISEVARAFCRVAKEIPGTQCTIYGSGRAEPALKEILRTEGAGLAVSFGGKLESTTVQAHLLQQHIFVLLSDYEGIPISLMEAMGCGLVPVCSNIRSGMTELIEHGETGFLVNDRGDDFVATIRTLKNNPALWTNLSQAARHKIEAQYSESVCNQQWLQLLQQLKASAGKQTALTVPSLEACKAFILRPEFKEYYNPRPAAYKVPFYRLRVWLGRKKRELFNQHY
ncbi:MAG: glycosyltransferase family 4 protein, partial [Ferruginibacter sp.]